MNQTVETTITKEKLSEYPIILLLPSSLYPDLKRFNWQQIVGLYSINKTCKLPSDIVLPSRAKEFELALCEQRFLNSDWFKQGELVHPAGGSYAGRYIAHIIASDLPILIDEVVLNLKPFLLLSNPMHPMHDQLMPLGTNGLTKLLSGQQQWYLQRNGSLWFYSDNGIEHFHNETWQEVAKQYGINIIRKGNMNVCQLELDNLCLQYGEESDITRIIIESCLILLCTILFLKIVINQYLETKERRFILQLLTHELRTPISSLGMTVEQFRDVFNEMTPTLQHSFSRLIHDYQRLKKLVHTSQGYLSHGKKSFQNYHKTELSGWLNYLSNKYNVHYCLETDHCYNLPIYWLEVCVENLIRNALEYGEHPVKIFVAVVNKRLIIQVQDNGTLRSTFLFQLVMRRNKEFGMGIGLLLVRRIIKQLGGRLSIAKSPTRFTIVYPL